MAVLDVIVFVGMIVIVGVVGVLSSKSVGSADEYLMAGRGLSKLQAAFSMAATDFGGSGLVGAIGLCYLSGLGGIWWNLAAAPAFLFVGFVLAKKLNGIAANTVPDYLGERYSRGCKLLSSTMHFLANVALLSTQYTIATATFTAITGIPAQATSVCVALLVLSLTLMGGLRAVVNTDATLFVVILISVFACVFVASGAAGGVASVISRIPQGFGSINSLGYVEPLSWILMCIFTYSTNQNYVQRLLSAKDAGTARFSAFFTAGFYVVISLALGFIGLCAHLLLPGIDDMNSIFPRLIMTYFPAGLLGMGIAGVFAATISTGSSILHSATTLFVNDIYSEVHPQKKGVSLSVSRVTTLCISLGALILSLLASNIIDVIYVASLFYSTSVFFPLIIGLNSSKATARGAMASIVSAVATGIVWELVLSRQGIPLAAVPSNFVSALVGLAVLVAVSAADRRGTGHNHQFPL